MKLSSMFKSKILMGMGSCLLLLSSTPAVPVDAVKPDLFSSKLEEVQQAISDGENLEVYLGSGLTPLTLAAFSGDVAVVKALLDAGADVNRPTRNFESALYLAVSENHLDVVRELISRGARLDVYRAPFHKSPLHRAVENGNLEMVKELVNHGANVRVCDCDGKTPADLAKKNGRSDIGRILEEAEYRVVYIHELCCTSLSDAVISRKELPNPDDFGQMGKNGALHWAAHVGNLAAVRQLIAAGADVNDSCFLMRNTALHEAVEAGHMDVVKELINSGAHVRVLNAMNKLPIDIAKDKHYVDIAYVLDCVGGGHHFG